jgi:chaperonin GroEL (HSP60 family)
VSLKDMTYEALCIAGLNGKVVLTKQQTQQDSDILELNDGSFFPEVISIFKLKNSKYLNPRIACIDGYIESVSEIHHLLEEASRLKENIFLFVRGISDEVVHTLKVNYDRGTLTVLPFIVKYDLDGVNLLNDIAIVTGGDVISSLKGQLISSVKLSTCHRVDYINVSDAGVLIEKLETRNKVNEHVHFLQKKLLELNEDTSKEFIAKRIKNLGSNRVTISLKLDHNATKKSFMIDRALRATKVAATHGVVEINNKLYPLATFNIAKTYYNLFLKEYRDLGAIIS